MLFSHLWLGGTTALFTAFLILLYFYLTRKFNYWKSREVAFAKPLPLFGNALEIFTFKKSIGDLCWDFYKITKNPFFGIFICDEPYLLIRDPKLIQMVLVKNFSIFNNRTLTENKESDPVGSHILFILKNPDWKQMRRKIAPAFTSGKLKLMYKFINEAGEDLVEFLKKYVQKDSVVDTREVSAKYTTDTITSTSFGINANCFKNDNSEFRQVSRRIFNWAYFERGFSTTCYFLFPKLVHLLKLKFIDAPSIKFLSEVFWTTMNERERTKFVRNDLLDILIHIKNNQGIDPYQLEGDKLVAQAVQFFIAGFETTSTTIGFGLYELALNQEIQQQLRDEIISVKQQHGSLTYDDIKEMPYLDKCFKETLRKYPVVPFLDRRINTDYTIPGSNVTLTRGTGVFISVLGLHYDPQYFPNPEKFDPERFSEVETASRTPFVYLPFGEGPRNCLGARFGTISTKSALAHVVSNFKVDICAETQNPMKFDPRGFLIAPIGGLRLKITPIN